MSSNRKEVTWGSRLFSLATTGAIFGTAFMPEGAFYNNLTLVVHVFVWIMLVLATVAVFIVPNEDMPRGNLAISIFLTLMWVLALAYVDWTVALITYIVVSVFGYGKVAARNNADPI